MGNRKDRRREKALLRRGRAVEPLRQHVTPIPFLIPADDMPSNVTIRFEGEGSFIYSRASGHPLAGARITGGPGGGSFTIGDLADEPALIFQPTPHTGSIFLYLEKEEWADTWVEGGKVPLSPASKYRSNERKGVMTPDEVHQRSADVDNPAALDTIETHFIGTKGVKAGRFSNLQLELADGSKSTLSGGVNNYEEHAYLFCAAYELSASLLERLENKVCVVEIADPAALKAVLDAQLGQEAFAGRVSYTDGVDRGHFMKSTEDAWQAEYRMAWIRDGSAPIMVDVPKGTAKRVTVA